MGTYGTFNLATNGNWDFTSNSAFDNLNIGDSVSETFNVQSEDGTASTVSITINGTNDAATVSSAAVSLTETDTALTTSGTLTSADVDNTDNTFIPVTTVGTYGTFNLLANGNWDFVANSTFDNLNVGDNVSETFNVESEDGTTSTVSITINGTNDAATVSSAAVVLTETDTALTTSGTLTSADVDNADNTFIPVTTVGTYGTFNLLANGNWDFIANSAFDNLNVGDNVSETFNVQSEDGTASTVSITINGANDAAMVSSAAVILTETDTALTTSGTLTSTDIDNTDNTFIPVTTVGTYGTFNLLANGNWDFTANSAFDSLNVGDNVSETFNVQSEDGTTSTVSITINGTNDAATVSSAAVTLTETDAPLTTSGTLTSADVDNADNTFVPVTTVGTYGTFNLLANGNWNFTANSAFDSLNVGDNVSETFNVQSEDGTANTVSITINGTNDAPVTTAVTASGLEDANSILITLGGSDTEGSVDAFRLDSLSSDGTLYTDSGLTNLAVTGVDYAATGEQLELYFVPNADWSGSTNFQYAAIDNNGLADSTSATATIDVTAVVDTPNLEIGLNESADKVVFNDNFNDGNIAGWSYIGFNGPNANWYVNNGTLVEDSGNRRGFLSYDMNQSGAGLDARDNYSIAVDVGTTIGGSSANNDAVGIVFGYTDNRNYYMVRWNDFDTNYSGSAAHRDFELIKVENNTTTVLDVLDQQLLPETFNLNVSVTQSGGIQVSVDGSQLLSSATEAPAIGTFGLWTDDNDTGVTYDNVRVTALTDGAIDIVGYEGVPIDFNIISAPTDTDGSEVVSTVISGVEVGATLNDGVNSFTATAGATSVDVSSWNLNSLAISGLTTGTYSLTVTTTATEQSNGDNTSTSDTLDIEVINVTAPVALDFAGSVMESGLTEGTAPNAATIATTGNLLQGQAGSSIVDVEGNTSVGGVITLQTSAGTLEVFTQAGNYSGIDRNEGDYVYTLENSTTEGFKRYRNSSSLPLKMALVRKTNGSLAINIVD